MQCRTEGQRHSCAVYRGLVDGGRTLAPLTTGERCAALYESIESLAILTHGPPQVVVLASDAAEPFVQMPGIAVSSSSMPLLLGKCLAELEALAPERFVTDDYAAFGQEIINFPETEAEAVIRPPSVAIDRGLETVLCVATCGTRNHTVITAPDRNSSQGPDTLTVPSLEYQL